MDWINKYNMIVEKMKNQMFAKGVDSLDKVFISINKFDPNNNNYIHVNDFANFLASLGIFLKTQETNELHKYLYTTENENRVFFEPYINLLKCEIPEKIINSLVAVFQHVKGNDSEIPVEVFTSKLRYDMFPRFKLMLKTLDQVKSEVEYSISFTVGEKSSFDENDFLEFHRNMYWVQPKENISNFLKMVQEIWEYRN